VLKVFYIAASNADLDRQERRPQLVQEYFTFANAVKLHNKEMSSKFPYFKDLYNYLPAHLQMLDMTEVMLYYLIGSAIENKDKRSLSRIFVYGDIKLAKKKSQKLMNENRSFRWAAARKSLCSLLDAIPNETQLQRNVNSYSLFVSNQSKLFNFMHFISTNTFNTIEGLIRESKSSKITMAEINKGWSRSEFPGRIAKCRFRLNNYDDDQVKLICMCLSDQVYESTFPDDRRSRFLSSCTGKRTRSYRGYDF